MNYVFHAHKLVKKIVSPSWLKRLHLIYLYEFSTYLIYIEFFFKKNYTNWNIIVTYIINMYVDMHKLLLDQKD